MLSKTVDFLVSLLNLSTVKYVRMKGKYERVSMISTPQFYHSLTLMKKEVLFEAFTVSFLNYTFCQLRILRDITTWGQGKKKCLNVRKRQKPSTNHLREIKTEGNPLMKNHFFLFAFLLLFLLFGRLTNCFDNCALAMFY